MRCAKCGQQVPEIYSFCLQCGQHVEPPPPTLPLKGDPLSVNQDDQIAVSPKNTRLPIFMVLAGGVIIAGIIFAIIVSRHDDLESAERDRAEIARPSVNTPNRSPSPLTTSNVQNSSQQTSLPQRGATPAPQSNNSGAENNGFSPPAGISEPPDPTSGKSLVPASFYVPARRYYSVKFEITANQGSMSLVGNFRALGGSGNDIEVLIFDGAGFEGFVNKRGSRTFYNSGKLSIGNIDIRLPPGTYYIVFNNNFSLLSNKSITAKINLINR